MIRHVLTVLVGTTLFLSSGCVERRSAPAPEVKEAESPELIGPTGRSGSEPLVLVYHYDRAAPSGSAPQVRMTGATDMSAVVDGVQAAGLVLGEGAFGNEPLFRVLAVTRDEGGRRVTVFEGRSEVQWKLVVEGATDVSIHRGPCMILKSDATFARDLFRVIVRVSESDGNNEKAAEFVGPKQRLADEAIVLTYYPDMPQPRDGIPEVYIEGALMTSSTAVVREPRELRQVSGTIDGLPAGGVALNQESRGEAPIFRVLMATMDEGGRRVAVFEGRSEVQWQLVVKGGTDVSIRTGKSEISEPDAVFSKGTFRVEVRAAARQGEKADSVEEARQSSGPA